MIARLDHHPMLTALLALTTAILVVVVITLATLLITAAPPAATSSSEGGANPAAPAAVPGTGENYGEGWNNYGHDAAVPQPAQTGNYADYGYDIYRASSAGDSQTSDSAERQQVGHP